MASARRPLKSNVIHSINIGHNPQIDRRDAPPLRQVIQLAKR
jgi:hypothetical protein